MDNQLFIVAFLIGLVFASLVGLFIIRKNLSAHTAQILELSMTNSTAVSKIEFLTSQCDILEKERIQNVAQIENLKNSLVEAKTAVQVQERELVLKTASLKYFQVLIDEFKKQSLTEIQVLGHKILDEKAKTFTESTDKQLNITLKPLLEKILSFEKSVDEKFNSESKERHTLKAEISRLIELNAIITTETTSLTEALKGDSKAQGDWGEMITERVLEASGLQNGRDYTTQKECTDENGSILKPDFIVNLPDQKNLIIDSKVSLTSYERYSSATNEEDRSMALNEHIKSIKGHIRNLAGKHYENLRELSSPEFVFMFIPIEAAYIAALRHEPSLALEAWNKKIAIVTSTTLMTGLKTVASVWKLERQNKSALSIAKEGAALYDKFCTLIEDLRAIQKSFRGVEKGFDEAFSHLHTGKGSVVKRIENLKILGIRASKQIPAELVEEELDLISET